MSCSERIGFIMLGLCDWYIVAKWVILFFISFLIMRFVCFRFVWGWVVLLFLILIMRVGWVTMVFICLLVSGVMVLVLLVGVGVLFDVGFGVLFDVVVVDYC